MSNENVTKDLTTEVANNTELSHNISKRGIAFRKHSFNYITALEIKGKATDLYSHKLITHLYIMYK